MHKTLTVLGATSEVAEQFVYTFLAQQKESWRVVLTSRKPERLEPLAADLKVRQLTDDVSLMAVDAANVAQHPAQLGSLADKTDVVICAMGFLGEQEEAESSPEMVQQILTANYSGLVSIMEVFAAAMVAKGKGSIIGLSSVAGERGRASNYFYGSAKAGFTAYLSGLRNRLHKKGVHVLSVIPGFMDTKMTDGLDLPGPLTASPEQAGQRIFKAYHKGKDVVYVLPIWWLVMMVIRNIPEGIFKKLSL
ncbi:MAG: SDR family oxidoreductase [Bacteroidota bacterium]